MTQVFLKCAEIESTYERREKNMSNQSTCSAIFLTGGEGSDSTFSFSSRPLSRDSEHSEIFFSLGVIWTVLTKKSS